MKSVFMIAGPNGAGKTTTAKSLISNSAMVYEFINADQIAAGLAPLHPESVSLSASKLMIKRFQELLESDKNFAFETTAAGINYIKHLQNAKSNGYEFHLTFLWLSSPDLAVKRVEHRVSQGGHNVPEETIRRRYHSGIRNLVTHYLPIANTALILDNSNELNKVIAQKNNINDLQIKDVTTWNEIEEAANA